MPGPEAFAEAAKSGIERQLGDLDAQYEARLIELAQEQAAAELTALRAKLAAAEAENARLREALDKIAGGSAFDCLRYAEDDPTEYHMRRERQAMKLAYAALQEPK